MIASCSRLEAITTYAVSSESTDVRFFAPDDLAALQIHPSIRTRVEDYLSNQAPVLR
jgi:hypothetical protein